MSEGGIDYYRVLGVLEDAEEIVIRAAYRALAQRYHPDKWTGDPSMALQRMSAINQAYSVLSDPQKRAAYNASRESGKYAEERQDDPESAGSAIERDWQTVLRYQPELQGFVDNLFSLAPSLAWSYQLKLLETKQFNTASQLARNMEQKWLERYFGTSSAAQAFAKELLEEGRRDAAAELNNAARVFGEVTKDVISKIAEDFRTARYLNSYEYRRAQQSKDGVTRPLVHLCDACNRFSDPSASVCWNCKRPFS